MFGDKFPTPSTHPDIVEAAAVRHRGRVDLDHPRAAHAGRPRPHPQPVVATLLDPRRDALRWWREHEPLVHALESHAQRIDPHVRRLTRDGLDAHPGCADTCTTPGTTPATCWRGSPKPRGRGGSGAWSRCSRAPWERDPVMLCLDGPQKSLHRNGGGGMELCLYYSRDPEERRWKLSDGLVRLFDLGIQHVWCEHIFRERGAATATGPSPRPPTATARRRRRGTRASRWSQCCPTPTTAGRRGSRSHRTRPFLSHKREDRAAVIALKRQLSIHGIGGWRDLDDLHLGELNQPGFQRAIDHETGGCIWYGTSRVLRSDYINNVELPAVTDRKRREPDYPLVPLFVTITPGGADAGLRVAAVKREAKLHAADIDLFMDSNGEPRGRCQTNAAYQLGPPAAT